MSRLICIDPGHGGSDPGAMGPKGEEKDYTLLQSHVTSSIAQIHNIGVTMTRLGDHYVPLRQRTQVANNVGADLFISYHYNAFVSEEPSGTQILHWVTSRGAEKLAEFLFDEIAPLDGENDRWEKILPVPDPNFRSGLEPTVLKYTEMPAVIIETEFGTNPDDAELLFEPRYMVAVAEATMRAVEEWYQWRD